MVVRKIQPIERITASKIQSIAFTGGRDFSAAEKEPERFIEGYENCRAVFDENEKMSACLELNSYEVQFDGKTVKMAGIGGVASLPEERNRGYIRALFENIFHEMRENKQWFSYLYPFSNAYYRQFGYEACLKKEREKIALTSFKQLPSIGQVKFFSPGEDTTSIKEIYSKFIKDKNLAVVRDEALWNRRLSQDPYKNNLYTYIWHNDAGEAMSYVTFKAVSKPGYKSDMEVQELIWLNGESLLGILGFLKSFVPRYEIFSWDNSGLFNMNLLFPEPYDVTGEVNSSGMNRIVDLEEVLKLITPPKGEGRLVFQVTDNFLAWNNGTYEVTWRNNEVEVEKKDGPADLSCSIQVLTQLITGYAAIEDFFWNKEVKVNGDISLLSTFFSKKPLYMNDYF